MYANAYIIHSFYIQKPLTYANAYIIYCFYIQKPLTYANAYIFQGILNMQMPIY